MLGVFENVSWKETNKIFEAFQILKILLDTLNCRCVVAGVLKNLKMCLGLLGDCIV